MPRESGCRRPLALAAGRALRPQRLAFVNEHAAVHVDTRPVQAEHLARRCEPTPCAISGADRRCGTLAWQTAGTHFATALAYDSDGNTSTSPISWSWSVDGAPPHTGISANRSSFSYLVGPGSSVTLTASTSMNGQSLSDSVTYTMQLSEPRFEIVVPDTDGRGFFAGLPVDFVAKESGLVPAPHCDNFNWSAFHQSTGSAPFATSPSGCRAQFSFPGAGTGSVTAGLNIPGFAPATRSRTVTLFTDSKPHVKITSPLRDQTINGIPGANVKLPSTPTTLTFQAMAMPTSGLEFTWTVSTPGQPIVLENAGPAITISSPLPNTCGTFATGVVTVGVTDSLGNMGSDMMAINYFTDDCPPN
jgi:hypothetical protein